MSGNQVTRLPADHSIVEGIAKPSSSVVLYRDLLRARTRKQRLTWFMLPLVLTVGWFYPLMGFFVMSCAIAALLIAPFRGRAIWCDYLCPRGNTWDLFLSKVSRKLRAPRFMKSRPFRVFWLLFFLIMISAGFITRWPNLQAIGLFQVRLLAVTTSVGIVAGILTYPRSWCQNFCPVGTIGGWIGGRRRIKPLKISSDCAAKCHNVCLKVCR